MKRRIILTTLVLCFLIAGNAVAQDERTSRKIELKSEKIAANVVRIFGAENAVYSRSGKFLAIQTAAEFLVLPTRKPLASLSNLSAARRLSGRIIGFLASDALIYSADSEIFALDTVKGKSRKLFSQEKGEKLAGAVFTQRESVIVSDDLIVTGDGDYDMGGNPGNIYRYDLKNRSVKKGAPVKQFWEAALSPSGKYILYERGGEESNYVAYYDISQDKNYEIGKRFNLKKVFPEWGETTEEPLVWVGGRDRFLAYVSSGINYDDFENLEPLEKAKHEKKWLCLFDAPTGRIVWKKIILQSASQSEFQPLSAEKVLINYGEDVYELTISNGREKMLRGGIYGQSFVLSPDKKRTAFVKSNQVLTSLLGGGSRRKILELPDEWKFAPDYKAMGKRPPLWSPKGDQLILFGENQLLIAKL